MFLRGFCTNLLPSNKNILEIILRKVHFIFEGNHGEDVKENYFYLDSTPTHSYMKALYKYPQNEYPYSLLERENRERGIHSPEFELNDTGKLSSLILYSLKCVNYSTCNK